MKKIDLGKGVVIEHGLLVAVKRTNGREDADLEFFHQDEWNPEGNPGYETQKVKNVVKIQGWNENILVKDLYKDFLLPYARVKAPGVLEFAWNYKVLMEVINPKTKEKTGYVFSYAKKNRTLVSEVQIVNPDKGRSLQEKLIKEGLIRRFDPRNHNNGLRRDRQRAYA